MLVLKREDDVKADYFVFLLSLFGDSMLKMNFASQVASYSEGREGRLLCWTFVSLLLSLIGDEKEKFALGLYLREGR